MESLEINLHSYKKVLDLVKQLPKKEIEKLVAALQKEFVPKNKGKKNNDLQDLILEAPTWSDKEYKNYLNGRKHFNQLRSK